MKLRLEDNTLRLRLSAEEVAEFRQAGRLETVVPLGPLAPDSLAYSLEREAALAGAAPQLTYTPGRIRVQLPAALADDWAASDTVSLRGAFPVAGNQLVHILVEKDLGCHH